jgi:hypothetical protein
LVENERKRFVYLLVVWQERPASQEGPAIWRCSLEETQTGRRHGFRSVTEMSAFLARHAGCEGLPGPAN